jgi:iron complex outermembrane receptor protein
VNFFGPEAADASEEEFLGAGNILLEWEAHRQLILHLGTGIVSRPANVTERFYAFAPAPGGFQLGNPTLSPEVKYEVELGADWIQRWGVISASVFHFWVNDYILPSLIDRIDVDNDGRIDNVRSFRNVNARLFGGEIGAVVKPIEHWSFPMSVSYVRGIDDSRNNDIPEIPPLESRLAVRADYGVKVPWWVELGGRFVSRQNRVDEGFPEDPSPGFAVFHLFGGVEPVKNFRLLLGIENLFDKEYHEHLTREAVLAAGDLLLGDEIPNPGRSFHVMGRYEF